MLNQRIDERRRLQRWLHQARLHGAHSLVQEIESALAALERPAPDPYDAIRAASFWISEGLPQEGLRHLHKALRTTGEPGLDAAPPRETPSPAWEASAWAPEPAGPEPWR